MFHIREQYDSLKDTRLQVFLMGAMAAGLFLAIGAVNGVVTGRPDEFYAWGGVGVCLGILAGLICAAITPFIRSKARKYNAAVDAWGEQMLSR